MEKNRIDFLESFGVCSEILRFFGYAHNSFLLMTKLNKKTREVLDFNYEAIINWLEENKIDVCFNRHNTSMMLLPFDLFNFDIYLDWDEITECFIEIINAIRMKKGWYFKEHFMHENLCIYDIRVGVEQTKLLYSYNEEFKLIKTRKCCDIKHSNFTDSSYLSEDFVLIIDDIYRSLDEIIKYLRWLNKGHDTQLNSTLYSFTKINNFSFRTSLFESSIAKLEDIKNLNLSFNYLCIKGQSEDEIEKLTNPHYFKNRVKNINYKFEEDHNLSDLFFSNIKDEYP